MYILLYTVHETSGIKYDSGYYLMGSTTAFTNMTLYFCLIDYSKSYELDTFETPNTYRLHYKLAPTKNKIYW